jgi:molecular chaperone GrpE (heat shock protein)
MSEDRTVSELVEQVDEVATDGIVAVEAPAPPEPDGEPQAAPEPDGIALALNALTAQLAEHQRLIERQAEVAANLHAENQRLRGGELRQAQSALVTSILRVLDDATQMAQTAKVPESREDLALVAEALTDALERNGVLAGAVEPGAPFDARAHRIALVEATPDPAADRTVARVVRPGFSWADGSVIRLTDVAVFRHTPDSQ